MRLLLFLLLSSVTLFAQRTPLKVNGTIVDNPNFTNGTTALMSRSGANISVAPTNIANAQIAAGAAIDISKLSGVAATSHVHAGEDITSGTVADARIASTIARDSEVASAINPPFVTLTDGATITVTCDTAKEFQNATVTLGGNRTLAISGAVNGMKGVIIVKQDGAGSRTLALPASSNVGSGGLGVLTLSSAANSIDTIAWLYDGTNYLWSKLLNYN